MRYILDGLGYIEEVLFSLGGSIQCNDKSCTEYTGTTPEGYDSLTEWYDEAISNNSLNAWKIVDNNLVYDENRYNDLLEEYAIQEEENATATHKWVKEQLETTANVIIDEFSNNTSGSSLVLIEDSGPYEIPKVILNRGAVETQSETSDIVNVISSNKNLLGIDALSSTKNGIESTINEDGSITLNGTASADTEFILKGTSTSLDMLFLIKENLNYVVSGLVDGTYIDLYNYDGTSRTLVSSSGNDSINLSNAYKITQSILKIAAGTTLENVVIYPQIEIDDEATSFIKHEENKATAIIEDGTAEIDTLSSYEGTTVLMADSDIEMNVDYFKYKSLDEKFAEIEVTEESIKSQVSETVTNITDLQEKVNTIQSTILEQTNEAFTMWFEQTGLQSTLDTVQNELNSNTNDLNTITEYIHFEGAEITLGKSDSQTKLVIRNDRISFMTGETESAYISENTLYITDSTILNKLLIGHWETVEDEYGNLNTKWVGEN